MKNLLRFYFQKIFGYNNYLFLFSLLNINRIRRGGQYEREFIHFLEMIPDDGSVILDIGANIGVMTASLAQEKKRATIFAFEPIPDNYVTIERVIRHYDLKNVHLFKVALGEEAGEVRMLVPVVGRSHMQGLSHVLEKPDNEQEGNLLLVPIRKLDDMPELAAAERISAIKIDVENFEYYVFKGAHDLLQKHRPLIYCELWNNERRALCFDYLKGIGYQVKTYQNGILTDFTGQDTINFFFVPGGEGN